MSYTWNRKEADRCLRAHCVETEGVEEINKEADRCSSKEAQLTLVDYSLPLEGRLLNLLCGVGDIVVEFKTPPPYIDQRFGATWCVEQGMHKSV